MSIQIVKLVIQRFDDQRFFKVDVVYDRSIPGSPGDDKARWPVNYDSVQGRAIEDFLKELR